MAILPFLLFVQIIGCHSACRFVVNFANMFTNKAVANAVCIAVLHKTVR